MVSLFRSAAQSEKAHLHIAGDVCPYCEQPIPNDRLDEIRQRIAAKDSQRHAEVEAKARADVEAVVAKSRADLEAATVAALARGRQQAEADLNARLAAAEAATASADKRTVHLNAMIEQLRGEIASKEAAARAAVSEEFGAKLAAAETRTSAAERLAAEMQAAHKGAITEVREAMEKAKADAVNAEQAKFAAERIKTESLVADLQRKLQNKTAEDLGEGAEVDLFEVLKAEFPSDLITRVGRGKAGADIIHKVRHNGATCGTIVYDSKNHLQFRTDHVAKLRQDQQAERAEHAVLSTRAFPKDKAQLHVDDGVVLTNPARAVVVAMILRQQIVDMHRLKVSNDQRTSKTAELYALMTSDRFSQFLASVTRGAEQLDALQVQEKKAHEAQWKKQGELFRSIIRACAQFDEEIARVIGTGPVADET